MEHGGVVIPILNTVYLIGEIKFGQGLEFISLKRPLSKDFGLLLGFTITMAYEGRPTMARVVGVPGPAQKPGIYPIDEIENDANGLIKSAIKNAMTEKRAHTFDGFRSAYHG